MKIYSVAASGIAGSGDRKDDGKTTTTTTTRQQRVVMGIDPDTVREMLIYVVQAEEEEAMVTIIIIIIIMMITTMIMTIQTTRLLSQGGALAMLQLVDSTLVDASVYDVPVVLVQVRGERAALYIKELLLLLRYDRHSNDRPASSFLSPFFFVRR